MAIQLGRLRDARARGMPRAGWKVGLNFPEVQARLKLGHAAVGWLDGHHVVASGGTFAAEPEAKLHVEAEVCLRIGHAVAAGTGPDEAAAAIAGIAPALEIVDYAKPWDGLTVILGHSMFHLATVRGTELATLPPGAALGERWPEVRVKGEAVRRARADLVPAHLGEIVAFVADFLAPYGETLAPGDLLLSGSYTDPVPVERGDVVAASYGDLGTVGVTIAA
jgi:2-keto-4-pentenoate hydratase